MIFENAIICAVIIVIVLLIALIPLIKCSVPVSY